MHQAAKMVREEELIRLLLAGHMMKECAVQLQLSYKTVRDYARAPQFLDRLRELSREVYERVDQELRNSKDTIVAKLEQMSEDSLDEMFAMARALPNGAVKLKALQDIMDRDTRISRQRRIEANTTHNVVDPEFLRLAASSARQLDSKTIDMPPAEPPKDGAK